MLFTFIQFAAPVCTTVLGIMWIALVLSTSVATSASVDPVHNHQHYNAAEDQFNSKQGFVDNYCCMYCPHRAMRMVLAWVP